MGGARRRRTVSTPSGLAAAIVRLRAMSRPEFDAHQASDILRYAEANIRSGAWRQGEAIERSRRTHRELLPLGMETPGHSFYTIEAGEGPVGSLWLFVDRNASPLFGFVYDFWIDEAHRRRGFGRAALLALEVEARRLGLGSLRLHVFADNLAARRLYQELGFHPTGIHLAKDLSAPRPQRRKHPD